MSQQTLRELARAHAQSELDRDSYRSARATLLQGIIAGTTPLQNIDYPPLVRPPEPENLDDTQRREDLRKPEPAVDSEATTGPKPGSKSSEPNEGSSMGLFAGLAVAVLALAVVLYFIFAGGGDNGSGQASTVASVDATVDSSTARSAAPATTESEAQQLIKQFLADKNWSNASLDSFVERWQGLSENSISTSQSSLELGQLTNAIYKQLLEEQALSGLVDDDSSLLKQQKLVEFAQAIGINDARISLPDQASAEVLTP